MNRGTEIALVLLVVLFLGFGLWWWYGSSVHVSNGPITGGLHTQVGTRSAYMNDVGQYYTAKASYPAETPLTGTANDNAVQTMRSFAENQIAAFKEQSNLANLTPEDIKIQGLDDPDRKYTLEVKFDTYTSPTTVSYVFLVYENTLGAHPNGYYHTFTWDLKSGKLLTLKDIIKTPDYLQKLSTLTRAELSKRLGPDANQDMLLAGTKPIADNFKNFDVSGTNLDIIFAPYQVGPYAIGTQTISIPLIQFTATSTAVKN